MKKPYLIVIVLFSFFVLNSAAAVLVNYDDMVARAMDGNKQSADSLKIYATAHNSAEAANCYSWLLLNTTSPFYNDKEYKDWVTEWYEKTESLAANGDEEACLSLGQALIGHFGSLRPINPDYDVFERGLSFLLKAAMKGNAQAQYLYADYNDKLTDAEQELWIAEAAGSGHVQAIVHLSVLELDRGNFDKTISLLDPVIDEYSAYKYYDYNAGILVKDIVTLARYLKKNPNISLRGFGPLKDDKTTFYVSLDNQILACATNKGKAGLLQLNNDGERINHDDIPFIYEYIIPISHDHLELSESTLYFQVSPYTFKLPIHDDKFRVLDKSAKECYLSLWSSYVPDIPLPNDYRVDGPYQ